MTFSELGLAAPILKALDREGYETPTPIQAKAIPSVIAGSDLLGIAQTGTGKTAAFALPILNRFVTDRKAAPRKGCRVLVLSPTRELASQIADSFRTYGRHLGLHIATVFGGVSYRPQVQAIARGVDILIATPGRLLDHMDQRTIDLSATEVLVLDEADQMLDLGFVKPIRRIVGKLPARRQNLFFSATMPREISGLADELLTDPVKVSVTPVARTADRIEQKIIHVESAKKRSLLVELFADPDMSRTLVFTRTKRGADKVSKHLEAAGIRAAAIHGNKSQRQREEALGAFKKAKIRVLVATDIAARGIDVDAVTHVVNFELPEVPEAYVHRIGRTARAGASGRAISLCDGPERKLLRAIEKLTHQTIPSDDRRNDATLEAESKPARNAQARDHGKQARTGEQAPGRARNSHKPDSRTTGRKAAGGKPAGIKPAGTETARPHRNGRPPAGPAQLCAAVDDRNAPRPSSQKRRQGQRRFDKPAADARSGERLAAGESHDSRQKPGGNKRPRRKFNHQDNQRNRAQLHQSTP